jgi:hypothetical protein
MTYSNKGGVEGFVCADRLDGFSFWSAPGREDRRDYEMCVFVLNKYP